MLNCCCHCLTGIAHAPIIRLHEIADLGKVMSRVDLMEGRLKDYIKGRNGYEDSLVYGLINPNG